MAKVEMGTCPVCNGTGRVAADKDERGRYPNKEIYAAYNKEDDTFDCDNCGGQRQWGSPTGKVLLRRDNGQPCVHEYTGQNLGRCYTGYTCRWCGDYFTIDSGD